VILKHLKVSLPTPNHYVLLSPQYRPKETWTTSSIAPQSMLVRAVTYGPSAWYPDLRATHHVQMSQNIPQVPFGQPEQVVLG